MKNKIAICIPAFSSAYNIKNCLTSIFKSNNNYFDLTILLFNNSNKQEIIDICKEYAFEFDCIQLFDVRHNKGCSATWNEAIEYVYFLKPNQFSTLLFVNDDIVFNENSFIEFAQHTLNNPDKAVVNCLLLL